LIRHDHELDSLVVVDEQKATPNRMSPKRSFGVSDDTCQAVAGPQRHHVTNRVLSCGMPKRAPVTADGGSVESPSVFAGVVRGTRG
jgi:hypothetical protein